MFRGANSVRLVVVALVAFAAAAVLPPQVAHAADQRFGGVEMMTASGHLLTGPAAANEYEALLQQPSINCGSCRKYVVITAQKMPFIARNISLAFQAGKPFLLHKANAVVQGANRKASCGSFQPNYQGWCDEYPFASSHEGGAGAHTQEVPPREQQCQGGTLSRQYAAQQITEGTQFAVLVTDTSAIPAGPYKGTDIARSEGAAC
jgi:hypothetical protein